MTAIPIKDDLLKELDKLTTKEQERLLEFAKKLARSRPHGTNGRIIVQIAGGINNSDLHKMAKAIEEDCERIEPNEW